MPPKGSLPAVSGDPPFMTRLHRLYRKARKRVLGPIQKPVAGGAAAASASVPREPASVSPPPAPAAPFAPVLVRSAATGAVQPGPPPGSVDAFAVRAGEAAKADAGETDAAALFFPAFERGTRAPSPPPPGVCFLVPADARSLPGVEMLILSLLDVYPDLAAPVWIMMETEPDPVHRRRFARLSPLIAFVTPPENWDADHAALAGEPARLRLTLHALAIADHDRIVVIQPDALVLGDIGEAWTGDGLILGHDVGDGGFVARSPLTGDHVFDTALISLPRAMRGPAAVAAMAAVVHGHDGIDPALDRDPIKRCWNLFARDRERTVLPLRCSISAMYVLKCLEGSRQGVCLLHDNGEDPWLPSGGK